MEQISKFQNIKSGKAEWIPLLSHVFDLHEGGLHAPLQEIPYRWEEVAPGADLGAFFGHWDSVHIACDILSYDPQNSYHQISNHLSLQQPDGLIPGHVRMTDGRLYFSKRASCPPLWPLALQQYIAKTSRIDQLEKCYLALEKQIDWFETHRKAPKGGFYYLDCLDRFWESGVEEGVRYEFGDNHPDDFACVDASAHVYALYDQAEQWTKWLHKDSKRWEAKKEQLKAFIQEQLFDEETGFFHDQWMIQQPVLRKLAFEGIWPLVTGAASHEQAQRVINENLLDPTRFFTEHPIPTVALSDPHFDYRFWRGPTRNSMTYWAAQGCIHYNRADAARLLLEKALDATNLQFKRTGYIWEFYHPQGGDPRELSRQSAPGLKEPCKNYLGHNPLLAMAKLWEMLEPKQHQGGQR